MKILALFCLLAFPALAADTTIVGKVVGVHDGDTLTLRTEDETLKVRLSDIDTPELGQPFGNNAKQALSAVAFGKTATIKSCGKDRYGRTLGYIYSKTPSHQHDNGAYGDGVVVSASRQDGRTRERCAKANKISLWADKNAIAPWDWRKGKR